jgi:hypothetical protein
MLFNAKVDVPLYQGWQKSNLQRLVLALPPAERHRIGLYTLWTHDSPGPDGRTRVIRNYVHSKVAIIDDCWATVGSANLDGTGLTSTDYNFVANVIGNLITGGANLLFSLIEHGTIDFQSRRSVEVNTAIFNDDFSPNAAVSLLRRRLWAEHLGMRIAASNDPDPNDPLLTTKPVEGWAKLWDTVAKDKVQGLKNDAATVKKSRVLPYPYDADGQISGHLKKPVGYFKELNLDVSKFDIRTEVRSFSFTRGVWFDE